MYEVGLYHAHAWHESACRSWINASHIGVKSIIAARSLLQAGIRYVVRILAVFAVKLGDMDIHVQALKLERHLHVPGMLLGLELGQSRTWYRPRFLRCDGNSDVYEWYSSLAVVFTYMAMVCGRDWKQERL